MSPDMRSVVWFRGKDLRLGDHPALERARRASRELVPVFVLSPEYFAGAAAAGRAPHRVQFLLEARRSTRCPSSSLAWARDCCCSTGRRAKHCPNLSTHPQPVVELGEARQRFLLLAGEHMAGGARAR